MTAECFLDTNIFLYAAMGKYSEPHKYKCARQLVATKEYSSSAQVLAEFYVNARKMKNANKPLSPKQAAKWVAVISRKPCQDVDSGIVMHGIENAQRYKISYWDGAIIAAAQRLGVKTIYSEDLNHEQFYGDVQVINPFKTETDTFQ